MRNNSASSSAIRSSYGREIARLVALLGRKETEFQPGLSLSLLRKIRVGREMPTDATHAAITAKLDLFMEEEIASLSRHPDKRRRLFRELSTYGWLQVDVPRMIACVAADRLLAYAADRLDARIHAARGCLHVILKARAPLPNFGPLSFCQQVQPRRFAALLRRFILENIRGQR